MNSLIKEIEHLKQMTLKTGELVVDNLKVAMDIYYH